VIAQMADGGHPMAAELAKLPVTYVDLPTGHWPMWSRPEEVANVILETSTS
jgi:pimeloyl-ACP methyl ester carboxylesterase